LELKKIIRELLIGNNFISLPELGSFVLKYEPAKLTPDGKSFLPPKQIVLFDTSRTFNDEVLERYLQREHNLTYIEASEKVKLFVNEIKQQLELGNEVEFDNIGTLSRSGSGIFFSQADDSNRLATTFGLESVEVVPKVTEAKPKVDFHKPSSKLDNKQNISKPITPPKMEKSRVSIPQFLAIAAVVVIIIGSGLLYFFPEFRFWNKKDQIIAQSNTPKADQGEIIDSAQIDSQKPLESAAAKNDNVEGTRSITEKVAVTTDKKKALFYEEPKAPDDKTYYIIVGSFEKMDNAQILYNKLLNAGNKPEILKSDGHIRVAHSKFTDRNRALRELERLRQEKPTESVWLLGL
jgi:nucleoid DNA-binding protein/cell division septation protein DedD